MCMIIDANTIPCVFSTKNTKHTDFQPVLNWLIKGKGKIVLGGKLWTTEIIQKQKSYVNLLLELNKFNKVHMFDNNAVNKLTDEIKKLEKDPDFDDPHIIALSIISKATIICSDDSRSFKFIKKIKDYDKNSTPPLIYTTIEHRPHTEMLSDDNICINGEHKLLEKSVADKILSLIENK